MRYLKGWPFDAIDGSPWIDPCGGDDGFPGPKPG